MKDGHKDQIVMRMRSYAAAVTAFSVCLWAVSLLLPSLRVGDGAPMSGADLLRQGWQGVRYAVLAWYANPAFWCAAIAVVTGWRKLAVVLSGLATGLALSSLATGAILTLRFGHPPALTLRVGFYVWVVAIAVLFAWSVACVTVATRRKVPACEGISDESMQNRD